MANLKISQLSAIVTAALEDLVAAVDDPSGTPATTKATVQQILDTLSGLTTGFTIADADLFAVNDNTDGITKGISLAGLRTALEAGLLPDEGENWKIVRADSASGVTNAATLQSEYTAAAAQTPYGAAVSLDNPYFLLLMPGLYDFGATGLTMDTIGLGMIGMVPPPNNPLFGDSSVGVGSLAGRGVYITSSDVTIDQTVNGIRLENLIVETTVNNDSTTPALALSAANTSSVYIRCQFVSKTGSNTSPIERGVTVSGYWEDCWCDEGNAFGSGAGSDAAGTFVRCYAGGSGNFGAFSGNATGVFIGCHTGNGFGGGGAGATLASGVFIDCVAGSPIVTSGSSAGSFGEAATASGTFINCRVLTANDGCFGGDATSSDGVASGLFINCYAGGDEAFGGAGGSSDGDATGTFYGCVARDDSFGHGNTGTVTGTFIACSGGDRCFAYQGVFNGTAVGCNAGTGSFGGGGPTGDCAGTVIGCNGGNDSFGGAGGDCSGLIVGCSGGTGSFAGNTSASAGGEISGEIKGCHGLAGSFSGSVGGNGGVISGRVQDCSGGESSFAGAGTGDTGGTISGILHNCHGLQWSFAGSDAGTGGTISGDLFQCSNEQGAFADGTTPGTISGRIEGCSVLGEIAATITGKMSYMDVTATTTDADGIQVGAGATVSHCNIRADGTGDSIGSAGAVTASIFLCGLNSAIDVNITNATGTPNNVVDADI